jgi:hypothetical protein
MKGVSAQCLDFHPRAEATGFEMQSADNTPDRSRCGGFSQFLAIIFARKAGFPSAQNPVNINQVAHESKLKADTLECAIIIGTELRFIK